MADQELRYVISVVDRATAELARLTGTIGSLAQTADRLNERIAGGADDSRLSMVSLNQTVELLQKSFGFLKSAIEFPLEQFSKLVTGSADLVRVYDEQAQAQVRLESALLAQGAAVEETSKSLREYAEELQRGTRFGDETILGVEAIVAGFVRGEDQIKRATKAALDLSSAFGTDVQTSALKVAQAIETGTLSLGRLQLQLTESQDPATRLNAALGAIEGRFGGLSEKLATVGAGPLEQLGNVFSGFQATLGELIAKSPEFNAFIDTAKELLGSLQEFAKSNSTDLIIGFGRVFQTSLGLAVVTTQALVLGIEKLVLVVTKIGEAFGVFDTVGATEIKIDALKTGIEDMNKELVKLGDQSPRFENLWGALALDTDEVAAKSEDLTRAIGNNQRAITELESKLEDLKVDPFQDMKKSAGELSDELEGLIDQFDEAFERNLQARRADTPEAEQLRRRESIDRATRNVEAAGLTGALDPLVQAMQPVADALSVSAEELSGSALLASQLDTSAAAAFTAALAEFDGSIEQWEALRDLESAVIAEWETAAGLHETAALGLSTSSVDLTRSSVDLTNAGAQLFGAADGLDAAADALGGAGDSMDAAAGSLDRAAGALQSAADALSDGGGTPQFASGAVVRRATRAIIGEAGPEAVIPLNEEGARFAARALGLTGGAATPVSVAISARNLTLSERGLGAVFSQFDRRLSDSLARQRRLRSGSLSGSA